MMPDYYGKPFKVSETPLEAADNLASRLADGMPDAITGDAVRHHLRELVKLLMERDHYTR
jgi:hypothetical protein